MPTVFEKRPGRWKVSGDATVYPTKEAAEAALGIVEPQVYETFEDALEDHGDLEPYEFGVDLEEEVSPLELLFRAAKNGDKS